MADDVRASISPMARKMADQRGVDLSTIKGSGPNGSIVRADIEKAAPLTQSLIETSVQASDTAKLTSTASNLSPASISPMAKKLAEKLGVDWSSVTGTGPNGTIVKADLDKADRTASAHGVPTIAPAPTAPKPVAAIETDPSTSLGTGIPHEVSKLSNMRKTIARRLTESKQTVPHIYLTVDIRLDALLKLRAELNARLDMRGIKLSVNDMLIKALGAALMAVPKCNVSFAGDNMLQYSRADISVAVSIPNGLITPIITDAGSKSISVVSTEMAALAAKAKEGELQPHEFQGGTASLSNMGMMGIKQFDAVINPPQGMIMAIGAGEKRPYVVDETLAIATVMTATGSFDHRAIDGADGAMLMKVFKDLLESPLGLTV